MSDQQLEDGLAGLEMLDPMPDGAVRAAERVDDGEKPGRRRNARTKRSRRKFCRARPNRPHVPELVFDHARSIYGSDRCRAAPEHFRAWSGQRWWCMHAIRCAECGRYLKRFLSPDQCPGNPERIGEPWSATG